MQFANSYILSDGILKGKHATGEFLGQQADFAARSHIVLVEITPAKDLKIANPVETLRSRRPD